MGSYNIKHQPTDDWLTAFSCENVKMGKGVQNGKNASIIVRKIATSYSKNKDKWGQE